MTVCHSRSGRCEGALTTAAVTANACSHRCCSKQFHTYDNDAINNNNIVVLIFYTSDIMNNIIILASSENEAIDNNITMT